MNDGFTTTINYKPPIIPPEMEFNMIVQAIRK